MTTSKNPLSNLFKAARADLMTERYPHLVITDALDSAVFEHLSMQFPEDDIILNGRTAKDTWFDNPACKVVADERVSALWRDFFAFHTSKAFFGELVALGEPQMRAQKPDLEQRAGRRPEDFILGMHPGGRGDPLADGADTSMECQFYLNYTCQPRILRGPHVDRPSELFAAMPNFGRKDDDSSGTNLDICTASNDLYPTRMH
jgi:hypothetical protein